MEIPSVSKAKLMICVYNVAFLEMTLKTRVQEELLVLHGISGLLPRKPFQITAIFGKIPVNKFSGKIYDFDPVGVFTQLVTL